MLFKLDILFVELGRLLRLLRFTMKNVYQKLLDSNSLRVFAFPKIDNDRNSKLIPTFPKKDKFKNPNY